MKCLITGGAGFIGSNLAKMMGGEYTHTAPRSGEAQHTCADIFAIKQILG